MHQQSASAADVLYLKEKGENDCDRALMPQRLNPIAQMRRISPWKSAVNAKKKFATAQTKILIAQRLSVSTRLDSGSARLDFVSARLVFFLSPLRFFLSPSENVFTRLMATNRRFTRVCVVFYLVLRFFCYLCILNNKSHAKMKKTFILLSLSAILCALPHASFSQGFFEKVDLGIDKFKYSKLDTNYIAPPQYKLMISVGNETFWNHDNIHIPFSWNDPDIYESYPGLENYETEEILSRTSQTSLNLRVSYCGFSASYAFTLNGKGSRKAFALGSNGNKFGFKMGFERNSLNNARFRDYRYLPLMYTFLDALYEAGAIDKHYTIDEIAHHSVYKRDDIIDNEDEANIGENDMWELDDIIRWYGNFYYAFNHRKFSMSAANYAQ